MPRFSAKAAPGVIKHAGRYKITEQNFPSLAGLRTWALAKFKGHKNFEIYWPAKWHAEDGVWYWEEDELAVDKPPPPPPGPEVKVNVQVDHIKPMNTPSRDRPPLITPPGGPYPERPTVNTNTPLVSEGLPHGSWFWERFKEWRDARKLRKGRVYDGK